MALAGTQADAVPVSEGVAPGVPGVGEPILGAAVRQMPGPVPYPPPCVQAMDADMPLSATNTSRLMMTTPLIIASRTLRELCMRFPPKARAAPAGAARHQLQNPLLPQRLQRWLARHPSWDARRSDGRCRACVRPGRAGQDTPAAWPGCHLLQRCWTRRVR